MWSIETTDTFDLWFDSLDTIKGSAYPNMKELRVQSKGKPIRTFFVFDPGRVGILLCGGHKSGNEKRFYDTMIQTADKEYAKYLKKLNEV